jgi:hypothetical protein
VSGVDAEPQPKWTFHVDRPSACTEAEREEHFQAWLDKFGQPYTDAVIEAGDTPWTTDVEQRRELFMRRYKALNPTDTQETAA